MSGLLFPCFRYDEFVLQPGKGAYRNGFLRQKGNNHQPEVQDHKKRDNSDSNFSQSFH